MNTKTLFFLIALLTMSVSLSAANREIKGNKKIITEKIQVSDFNEVEMTGGMEVEYTSESGPSFEISVDENILPYINIEVKGNKLVVQPKRINDGGNNNQSYNLNPSVYKIKMSSKALESINSAGSGRFTVNSNLSFGTFKVNKAGSGNVEFTKPVKGNEMKIEMAGSGHVIVEKAEVKIMDCAMAGSGGIEVNGTISDGKYNMAGSGHIKVNNSSEMGEYNLAGSGRIEVSGTTNKAKYNMAGSGKINAFNCKTQEAKADLTGSGHIDLTVSNTLNASTMGSGKIAYKGNPSVDKNESKKGAIYQVN